MLEAIQLREADCILMQVHPFQSCDSVTMLQAWHIEEELHRAVH
jgi:hypothetical protein